MRVESIRKRRERMLKALPSSPSAVLPGVLSEDELRAYILQTWGVLVPDVQVCPQHSTPWRALWGAYSRGDGPVSVWKASRGFGGKTYLLALLALTEAVTLGADVSLLGGSGAQSINVHQYHTGWWLRDAAPRHLLAGDPGRIETRLTTGNAVRALMASQRSVRGPHPQRLRCDEVDEMDLALLDAAAGQPMDRGLIRAQTVLSSTHQYADGTMTEVLARARDKGWAVHEWCWRESLEPHGWLTEEQVETKRGEVTSAMWGTEYDLQEPAPDSRAIDSQAVARYFDPQLGHSALAPRAVVEFEPPVPGATYATGADWARKRDWTWIITLRCDCTPRRLVAVERTQREPWPVMIARLDSRVQRYPGRAAHDATGVGDVVADHLKVQADPVLMVGRDRTKLLSSYILAIEHDELRSPFVAPMEAEHRLASIEAVYGSLEHLPDSIAAGALAWRAATTPTGFCLRDWAA